MIAEMKAYNWNMSLVCKQCNIAISVSVILEGNIAEIVKIKSMQGLSTVQ
jgi:hypothetical protein